MFGINKILSWIGINKIALVEGELSKKEELGKAEDLLKSRYGPFCKIKKFFIPDEFFKDFRMAKQKKCPYTCVVLHESPPGPIKSLLKNRDPKIRIISFTDFGNLDEKLSTEIKSL